MFPIFPYFFPILFNCSARALMGLWGGKLAVLPPLPPAAAVLFLRGLERQQYIASVTANSE